MSKTQSNIIVTDSDLANAHGTIPVSMTNDLLFHILMQRNKRARKFLICSLLHLEPDKVKSVTVLNPISLKKEIDSKKYFLDVLVDLDDHTIINLELQVINKGNWPERSLSYLSRTFDNLQEGEGYINVRPVIHIGILNFTLFEDSPEFFATYYVTNIKNHRIYSSKFRLSVLDLTQIDLATDEDRAYHIDQWAAFFKATTWEELNMLAQKNPYIKEAVRTVYRLTQKKKIRQLFDAREDQIRCEKDMQILRERAEQERDQAVAENKLLRNLLKEHGINPDGTDK